jgi:predicted DNA-binding protein
MLKSMGELAQLFDVEATQLKLLPACNSALNRPEFRVRIEALKALSVLSMRLGAQKCKTYILPVVEHYLVDAEDLVVVEAINMYNQLVIQRLISQ